MEESLFVDCFHYRLEPLVSIAQQDFSIMGYELLAGKEFCPSFDVRGWRLFYHYLVTELPKILDRVSGMLFVNLDGEHMLDDRILEAVNAFPVNSQRLVLEWTEHAFRSENMLDVLAQIARFKKFGFQVAVDDIGSGVDGMGRAIACKPHYAKIDGGLLHHARKSDEETGHKYIRGMVQSLQSSGAKVLLEWVETAEDLSIAQKTGADFGQGFLWSKEIKKGLAHV